MNSTGRYQRLRKALGWAMFLSLAIVLLATVSHFAMIRQSVGHEIVMLERTRDRFQVVADRWRAEAKRAVNDKRVLSNVFSHCRTAEDIPDLQGNRIVARRYGSGRLLFYVPKGSHQLEISSMWQSVASSEPAEVGASADANGGEKTWSVALLPACGYLLKLVPDRQGRLRQASVRWA